MTKSKWFLLVFAKQGRGKFGNEFFEFHPTIAEAKASLRKLKKTYPKYVAHIVSISRYYAQEMDGRKIKGAEN